MPAGFALAHARQPIAALPQRILLLENSRAYTSMLREAIEQRVQLPISVASTLAEARELLERESDWFLALTGLVLADGDRDQVIDFFVERRMPTIVVSGVYDEALRERALQQHIIDYVLKSTPDSIDYLAWLVQRLERNRRIAALVVDDSRSARQHAAALLSMYGFRVIEAADGEAGLAMLDANPDIRLAIVDQEMPGMKGHEFTRRLRARHARDHLAIIGISGTSDGSLVPRFLKSGANDFLHKPFSREEFFCRVSQNIDQLELIGTLQDLATRDFLTGLPNRRHFLAECHALLPNTLGRQQSVTAAIIDIDHFKHINDTYGHEAGDVALKAVAQAIARHSGTQDLVARFGGEEFCALVPYLGESESVEYFESLRAQIEALEVDVGGQTLRMTVSIGVFRTRFPGQTLNHLLSEADRRLYLAKAGGRNRVELAA